MNTKIYIGAALVGAAIFGALTVSYVSAQTSRPEKVDDMDRAAIEMIVRDYLHDNPEVIVDALNAYSEKRATQAMAEATPLLLDDETGYSAGKNVAGAKVAVIELMDYHCGFCKRATGFVKELTNSDPAVKVVFRELPILRKESEIAARYALAARAQGKYKEFHFAMMDAAGVLDEKRITEIAQSVGLDTGKLKAGLHSPTTDRAINDTREAAERLQIDGTPSFLVVRLDGSFSEIIPGFRPDDVKDAIARAKKAG